MKGQLILCQILCTAVGCIVGALALSSVGTIGAAFLTLLVAVVLGAIGLSKIVADDMSVPTMRPAAKPEVKKAAPKAAPAAQPAKLSSNIDMLGMSEEMAFSSQQLVWGIGQFKSALSKLDNLAQEINSQSQGNASSLEEASAGVMEIADAANQVSETAQSSLEECHASADLARR